MVHFPCALNKYLMVACLWLITLEESANLIGKYYVSSFCYRLVHILTVVTLCTEGGMDMTSGIYLFNNVSVVFFLVKKSSTHYQRAVLLTKCMFN